MGFSPLVVLPAIFPWTEQLHLFLLLLTIFICLRNKEVGLLIGALLAVICIVRMAAVYNALAFAIALVILRGFSKRAVKEYGKASVAFLAFLSLYELLCFCKYGALYPQYFAASKTYRMAEIYPGAFYRNALPVLNMEHLVLLLFRIEIKNYLVFRNYYLHIHPRRYMGYRRDRDEMYEWIRENSGRDDLIASNFLADAFLLKRPFVSLPPSKAVTPENIVDFLKIYEPRYVLTIDQGLVNILKDTGYTEKKRKGRMVIFGK
jgi:hypothetical protein